MYCARPIFMKGATAYEAQWWRVCVRLPYWRFLVVGCWPSVMFDRTED
jgi:hypothetical protein